MQKNRGDIFPNTGGSTGVLVHRELENITSQYIKMCVFVSGENVKMVNEEEERGKVRSF